MPSVEMPPIKQGLPTTMDALASICHVEAQGNPITVDCGLQSAIQKLINQQHVAVGSCSGLYIDHPNTPPQTMPIITLQIPEDYGLYHQCMTIKAEENGLNTDISFDKYLNVTLKTFPRENFGNPEEDPNKRLYATEDEVRLFDQFADASEQCRKTLPWVNKHRITRSRRTRSLY